MAFVYCGNCSWGQDDFWHESGYNPFSNSIIEWYKSLLFKDHMSIPDAECNIDRLRTRHFIKDGMVFVDTRDAVATFLEQKATSIRQMRWKTEEDFRNDDNAACPNCLSTNLRLD